MTNKQNPDKPDIHQRFLFENYDIRGEIVSLSTSVREVYQRGDYPEAVQVLLGQFMAASCLLSANLKFNGVITLQANGNGPIPLIMADCSRNHHLRAIARFAEIDDGSEPSQAVDLEGNFQQLVGKGHLAITVQPENGERYQGIVPLEHAELSDCLTEYFSHSQQLATRVWLSSDSQGASGLLLQTLPSQLQSSEERDLSWEHLCQLSGTLSKAEQLTLHHSEQLHRLFHQDSVRLFEETPRQFACSCSQTRLSQALVSLGRDEAMDILREQPNIEITCEFCNHHYLFHPEDINALFDGNGPIIH